MKVKVTQIKAVDKYNISSYDELDVMYLNTDEHGFADYIFPHSFSKHVWVTPSNVFNEMLKAIQELK